MRNLVAAGAGPDANTGLSNARERAIEAAGKKANDSYATALDHLTRALTRRGIDDRTAAAAVRLLGDLFYGPLVEEDMLTLGATVEYVELDESMTRLVHHKFAMTAVLHRLTGLPGQADSWYAEEARSAAAYFAAQGYTNKSGSAPVKKAPAKKAAPAKTQAKKVPVKKAPAAKAPAAKASAPAKAATSNGGRLTPAGIAAQVAAANPRWRTEPALTAKAS